MVSPHRTHYEWLGITQTDDAHVIHRAYQEACRRFAKDPAALQAVTDAYKTLINPILRRDYNRQLLAAASHIPAVEVDLIPSQQRAPDRRESESPRRKRRGTEVVDSPAREPVAQPAGMAEQPQRKRRGTDVIDLPVSEPAAQPGVDAKPPPRKRRGTVVAPVPGEQPAAQPVIPPRTRTHSGDEASLSPEGLESSQPPAASGSSRPSRPRTVVASGATPQEPFEPTPGVESAESPVETESASSVEQIAEIDRVAPEPLLPDLTATFQPSSDGSASLEDEAFPKASDPERTVAAEPAVLSPPVVPAVRIVARVVVSGVDRGIQRYPLYEGRNLIGRPSLSGPVPDVPLPDSERKISRRHAVIEIEHDEWYVVDLGSRNGTLLNGKKLAPETRYRLKAGDLLLIESYSLRVISPADQDLRADLSH